MATKQQDNRNATPTEELTERSTKVERPRREAPRAASWFSFGDWRMQSSSDEWALA